MLFKKNQRDNDFQFERIMINRSVNQANRRRPVRDTGPIDQSFQSHPPNIIKNDILTVYEPQHYAKLQGVLTKRLQMIIDNIEISREKNKLKDKEIQIIAQSIDKTIDKISSLQLKTSEKQKKLNDISLKCHDKTDKSSRGQQKIKKQSILLAEEISKCQSLQSDIKHLQEKHHQAEKELQNCKRLYNSLDHIEEENQHLRLQFSQLQDEEKMIEYRQSNQKLECEDLEHKLQELRRIYKERSKINKRNLVKLNTLKREINGIEDSNHLMHKKVDQIKNLQLELGELNQQLLLFNEDIAEFDFKIRKKQKAISDLKDRIRIEQTQSNSVYVKKRPNQIIESEEQPSRTQKNSSKNSRQNSASKSKHELSVNSRDMSPNRNRSNLTPTFPSHELQVNVQSSVNNVKSADEMPNDAFRNIEKLINRFEQIKNKDKSKT